VAGDVTGCCAGSPRGATIATRRGNGTAAGNGGGNTETAIWHQSQWLCGNALCGVWLPEPASAWQIADCIQEGGGDAAPAWDGSDSHNPSSIATAKRPRPTRFKGCKARMLVASAAWGILPEADGGEMVELSGIEPLTS
jgi:hypothetical protein